MRGEMSGGADRDSPLRAGFYTGLRSPGAASLTGCDISQRSWMGTLSHSATGLAPSHSHTHTQLFLNVHCIKKGAVAAANIQLS